LITIEIKKDIIECGEAAELDGEVGDREKRFFTHLLPHF
jgi:hypothetical protein